MTVRKVRTAGRSHRLSRLTSRFVHRDGKPVGEVRLWDMATGQVKLSPAFWPGSDVQAVAFSPDGKAVAAGGLRGLRVWDAATGRPRKGETGGQFVNRDAPADRTCPAVGPRSVLPALLV
jgi:WD40 repeat protein